MDFFYIIGVYAFFVISWGLVRLCEEVECRSDFAGTAARRTFERSDW